MRKRDPLLKAGIIEDQNVNEKNLRIYLYDRASIYVSHYECSEKRLSDYLTNKIKSLLYQSFCNNELQALISTFSHSIIKTIIADFSDQNIISNQRFADIYIDRYIYQGRSYNYIKQKFYKYGIDIGLIKAEINSIDEFDNQQFQTFIERKQIGEKLARLKKDGNEKKIQALIQSLQRKGFSYHLIISALKL